MLPILTGNVGISGGNSGARESTYTITIERLPVLDNPVKTSISCFSWTDAIDHGPQMTAIRDGVRGKDKLDVPIKFIWNYAGNTLVNQHSDINKTHEILQDESKCEMIVVIENFMTSSAKYADILLPDLMTVEQEDIIPNDYAGNLPGVSAMGQGAWHEANMSGDKIDHGGCVNTLTTLRPSPLAKGNPQHTNLVEIEKI